jgi:hypothetical protein
MTGYDYPAAAERLGIPETWLRRNVPLLSLPHRKYGKHVRFTDEDLVAIAEMHRVSPVGAPMSDDMRPVTRRRSA